MNDYNNYDFTININDVVRLLVNAYAGGYDPIIIINGLYYNVTFLDDTESEKSK